MVAALHAQRILEAWDITAPEQRNSGLFEIELKSAISSCRTAAASSSLEDEQQAVLESVACQLSGSRAVTSPQMQAGLSLLRHLRTRIN